MDSDALAPYIARLSAAMVTLVCRINGSWSSTRKNFHLHSIQCSKFIENENIYLCILKQMLKS